MKTMVQSLFKNSKVVSVWINLTTLEHSSFGPQTMEPKPSAPYALLIVHDV